MKVAIIESMEADKKIFSDETEFWKHARSKHAMSKQKLSNMLRNADYWRKVVKSKGSSASSTPRPSRVHGKGKRSSIKHVSLGFRKHGAGRRRDDQDIIDRCKAWLNLERMWGHHISQSELMDEFRYQLEKKLANKKLKDPRDEKEIGRIDKRLHSFTKYKSKKAFADMLMHYIGARSMKPHRITKLSAIEEHVRAQLTWQSIDKAMHLAAFGTSEALSPLVLNPDQFIHNRRSTVIAAADQIPLWVKMSSPKIVYAEHELHRKDQATIRSIALDRNGPSQGIELPCADNQGQSQLRHRANHQDDRFRITYEARQIIHNWLDGTSNKSIGSQ
jgi:hypothetical protein